MITLADVRKPLVLGPVTAVFVIGLAFWGSSSWAKGAIEARLSGRLGVPVVVDSVRVGLGEQHISAIRVGGAEHGLDVRIDGATVRASLLSLLGSGRNAVEAVRVERLSATVNSHRLESSAKHGSREPGGADDGAQGKRRWPGLTVEDFALRVLDQEGEVLSMRGESLVFSEGALHVALPEGLTLRDRGLSLELKGMSAEAERTERGMQLRNASIADLHAHALAEEGSFSRLPRLRAAVRALRSLAGSPRVATQSDEGSARAKTAVLALLAPDGRIEVKRAEFDVEQEGALKAILKKAQTVLSRSEDGRLKSSGQGTSVGGGSVSWEVLLELDPLAIRADVEVDKLPLTLLSGLVPQLPWYEPEKGRLSANLRLRSESKTKVSWEGELRVLGAALSSARIAPVPVTDIDLTLTGHGSILPLLRRLDVEEGQVSFGQAQADVVGHVAVKDGEYSLALDAHLPNTDCGAAIAAIPTGLLGELSEARLRGKITGGLKLSLDSQHLDDTVLEISVRDRCDFLDMTANADLRRFRMPFRHAVVEPDGSVFQMETGPGTTAFTYLEDISPFLVHAVLAHEDTRFFTHEGFSPPHIRNALVRNLQEGRYVVGASTITMQLVKNLLLHREKTLARKVQEVLLTWYVERVMDKREILELYLNVIEYGPSVYGIRAAAQHYFKRLPSQLSPAEAAFFATILPSPKRYHEYYDKGALSGSALERVRALVRRLGERGSYDEAAVAFGQAELADFMFVKEGQVAAPRTVTGSSAPLPYQTGYWSDQDWDMMPTNQAYDAAAAIPR